MVMASRVHRSAEGRPTPFPLARHGPSMVSAVLVAFLAAALSGCAHTSPPVTAADAASATQMTDEAVDNFVKGKVELGGSGGFAIGTYGLGASATGELKGGLEMIILSTNEGAFAGGGWAEVKPSLAKPLNDEIYGKNVDVSQILAARGGKYAPAIKVRQILSQMVVEAWE